ncbi:MAG: hypothetical protein JWP66_1728 [Naasia sp.]|nr:hypothetical protein [Naasia sp.]
MERSVSVELELTVETAGELVLAIAVALPGPGALLTETLRIDRDGEQVAAEELADGHTTRLHRFSAGPGPLRISYRADVSGRSEPAPIDPVELIAYLRPSRYVESDTLRRTAEREFPGLTGVALAAAVRDWVAGALDYVPGWSVSTDGAAQTLLDRRGVCRDFAHLCTALLRALDVPARVVSVYAPGLVPMDFHAVCEAFFDGAWHVLDATGLAPRPAMLRIATGRDAADTAFLSNTGGIVLHTIDVRASVDETPDDDGATLVRLG